MSEQNRDQLAKAIYGRLFSYLVNTANDYLQGQDDLPGYAWMCTFNWISEDILGYGQSYKSPHQDIIYKHAWVWVCVLAPISV